MTQEQQAQEQQTTLAEQQQAQEQKYKAQIATKGKRLASLMGNLKVATAQNLLQQMYSQLHMQQQVALAKFMAQSVKEAKLLSVEGGDLAVFLKQIEDEFSGESLHAFKDVLVAAGQVIEVSKNNKFNDQPLLNVITSIEGVNTAAAEILKP